MSTRAIAPIVGVSQRTVANDATGEYSPVDEPRTSHGMDGKTRHYWPTIKRVSLQSTPPAAKKLPTRPKGQNHDAPRV